MTPEQSVISVRNQFYETASGFVSDDEIRGSLWEAEREFNSYVECYVSTAVVTTVTGTQEYAFTSFASNVMQVRHLTYDGDKLKKIDFRDLHFLDDDGTTSDASTGDPTHYYEWGSYVGLWPVPTESATVKMWGVFNPPEPTASYSIPVHFHHFLHDYVLYRLYLKDQDDGRAAYHKKLWEEHKQEGKLLWNRRMLGDKLPVVKDCYEYPGTTLGMV